MRRSAEKICWEDLLRKSAEKICWEDLLRRSAEENLLRRSAEKICWEDLLIRQWEDLLRRSAEKICWEDLLRKSAEKICWEDLLRRSAEENLLRRSAEKICWKICWEDLLRKSAEKICWEDLLKKICWEDLLRRSAEKICWEDLLRMVVDQDFFKISFFFYAGWVWSIKTGDHPLVTSCSSDVQNWGEMRILYVAAQPSRRFVLIGRPKLRWNANFWDRRRNPLVVSCSSDVQNWGEMRIGLGRRATLSSFRAHQTSKTEVKCEFWTSFCNPLVTSCWSDVRNCGKMVIFVCRVLPRASCAGFIHFCVRRCSKTWILKSGMARRCSETHILLLLDEPSRRIRWVDGTKLWRNANFLWKLSEASRETFVLEALFYEIWRKLRTKRSFWRIVLCEISKKPRTKRSFWKLVLWNFEEASHETIVLEAFSVKMVGSITRNARFASLCCEISKKPRTKRSFWKLVLWNFEEASHETIVLEAFSVKIVGSIARNARFASLCCENCRKHRAKRSFWKLVLWNFEEASHETIVLEAFSVKIVGSIARNARFGSFFCENGRKHRAKRSFCELVLLKLSEASRETLVLEACSVKFGGSLARNDRCGLWNLVLVAAFSY